MSNSVTIIEHISLRSLSDPENPEPKMLSNLRLDLLSSVTKTYEMNINPGTSGLLYVTMKIISALGSLISTSPRDLSFL